MRVQLGHAQEIAEADGPIRVRTHSYDIFVVRINGTVYAMENPCSHAGAALHEGRIRNHVVTCPSHLAQFDVRDGSVVRPPLEGDPENIKQQRVFAVAEENGVLYADVPDDMEWPWLD